MESTKLFRNVRLKGQKNLFRYYSDLERATEDIEYQKKLLKELGIE